MAAWLRPLGPCFQQETRASPLRYVTSRGVGAPRRGRAKRASRQVAVLYTLLPAVAVPWLPLGPTLHHRRAWTETASPLLRRPQPRAAVGSACSGSALRPQTHVMPHGVGLSPSDLCHLHYTLRLGLRIPSVFCWDAASGLPGVPARRRPSDGSRLPCWTAVLL